MPRVYSIAEPFPVVEIVTLQAPDLPDTDYRKHRDGTWSYFDRRQDPEQ